MKTFKKIFLIAVIALITGAMFLRVSAQSRTAAEIALTEGNFMQAQQIAAQAINSRRATATDYAIRGLIYFVIENNRENALADLRKAVTLEPNNGVALGFLSSVETDSQLSKQAAEKALAVAGSPRSALEYYARSSAFSTLGRKEEMIADVSRAIELSPRFSSAYNRRGYYYRDKKDFSRAIADFSKAIEYSPNYGFAYSNRGSTYVQMQSSSDRAIEDLTKSLEFISDDPFVYLDRGVAYARSGKSDLSFADYNKAIQLFSANIAQNPQDYSSLVNRGITYSNIQNYAKAIEDFNAYLKANPNDMPIYLQRSKAYEAVGKDDLAKLDRQKYAALGGNLERNNSNDRSLYPSVTFDAASAKNSLAIGSSTIRGRACTIKDGLIFTAANVRISLYPVTPYLEEWKRLRDKEEDKNTAVYLSAEAARYRIDVVTDSDGKFQFTEMKPGKYFLQGVFSFNQAKSRNVFVGADETTDYYRREDYTIPRSDRLEKTVEVKKDGDLVKLTISKGPPLRFLKFGGACSTW